MGSHGGLREDNLDLRIGPWFIQVTRDITNNKLAISSYCVQFISP